MPPETKHSFYDTSFMSDTHFKNHFKVHEKLTSDYCFKCDICKRTFCSKSDLGEHYAVHVSNPDTGGFVDIQVGLDDIEVGQIWEKEYACDICHKTFKNRGNFSKHHKIHMAKTVPDINRNSTTKSVSKKMFQCRMCSKHFSRQRDLKRHEFAHTGEKPYKCGICPIGFSRKDHLREHQALHTGEKPYRCDDCFRCFVRKSDLVKHYLVHIKNTF